jgi:hypothetical protein
LQPERALTGRLIRTGKAAISAEVSAIFERLQTSAEAWQAKLKKRSAGRMFGRFYAASRETLRALAERIGVCRLANLAGRAVT